MRTRTIPAVLLLVLASIVAFAAPSSAATTKAVPKGYYDWTTYHYNRGRSGYDPLIKHYGGGLHVSHTQKLDGQVYASPIVVNNLTIVATENNSVYAYGLNNKLVWKRFFGAPSPASERPCGNIDPLGITGTPVYDPSTKLIYVAAELKGTSHRLYGIRASNGTVAFSRSLDLPGVDQKAMQERGALTLAGHRVWVPFGGLAGDCGAYKGRVIGYSNTGGGNPVSYTVPTSREAGIWTPPGPTVAPSGNLFVAVGNGESGPGDAYDHSDSVLKLSPGAKLLDSFSPTTWPQDNQADLDLGSQGPALVGQWIFAAGKRGTAYVMQASHLGGIGGQVSQMDLCKSFGGTSVYKNIVFVPCTDGLRAVQIDSKGTMHVLWHVSATGSPVIGGGLTWSLDTGSGTLHGYGPLTGHDLASVNVGSVTRFATPALSGNRVIIGTITGFTIASY